jgi:hypothetical protein
MSFNLLKDGLATTIPESYLNCDARHRLGSRERREQKVNSNSRNGLFGGADLCRHGEEHSPCSCAFTAQQSLEKHRTGKSANFEAGERSIFRKKIAKRRESYGNWLLPSRVSSRGRRTPDNGSDLAGDAAVA